MTSWLEEARRDCRPFFPPHVGFRFAESNPGNELPVFFFVFRADLCESEREGWGALFCQYRIDDNEYDGAQSQNRTENEYKVSRYGVGGGGERETAGDR